METANTMGQEIARRGLTCVYGGSSTGLMKGLADSILAAGGRVVGVTVQALKDRENFHHGLSEMHVLQTMHERKQLMIELADGFIALPGGVGTFEEFFEVYTLKKMGFHNKPCGLLNVHNYYAPLDEMLACAEREGFMRPSENLSIHRSENPAALLDLLQAEAAGA